MAWGDQARTVSIALKDRSAIGMGGHKPDLVFWYAPDTKIWTSSTAYMKTLPAWLKKFNDEQKAANKSAGEGFKYGNSPLSVDDTFKLADLAIKEEKLGAHPKTDLLYISVSAHDYAGHMFGDEDPKFLKVFKAEDASIATFLKKLKSVKGKVLVVLTADHGAGVDAVKLAPKGIPSGRVDKPKHADTLNKCLKAQGVGEVGVLLSSALYVKNMKGDLSAQRQKAKQCMAKSGPPYWYVLTKDEILENKMPNVPWLKNLATSIHPALGPDVVAIPHPYWVSDEDDVITHETPYQYDSLVPLAFWGPGIPVKKVYKPAKVTSLAPTLSTLMKIRRPSGSTAELLEEIVSTK
jgi:hypothetical protein